MSSARIDRCAVGVVAGAVLACAVLAIPPVSWGEFRTGFVDNGAFVENPSTQSESFDRAAGLGADLIRLDLFWSSVAGAEPSNPADPADPAYDFGPFDAAVQEAAARGFDVMLTFSSAPRFAEGSDRPSDTRPGTWKPDPVALGDFARAVATRYSGNFADLPRVRHFEVWNEPNLSDWLTPQWNGSDPASPDHYRRMLEAVRGAVEAVHKDNNVIGGGLAPYGDPPSQNRMRPLRFLRELFCLTGKLKAQPCPSKPRFDVLSHHPINTSGPPTKSAVHPDDASTPDLKFVRRTLRAAEREGTIAGGRGHRPLWATEIWWESNPPDQTAPSVAEQARRLAQSMYILWQQGAKVVVNLVLRDGPHDPDDPYATISSGVYFNDGSPKPAAQAFRFPFVGDRLSERRIRVWGKAPVSGQLRIERQAGGGWRKLRTINVREGGIFTERLRLEGGARLRASVGEESSLVWRQAG